MRGPHFISATTNFLLVVLTTASPAFMSRRARRDGEGRSIKEDGQHRVSLSAGEAGPPVDRYHGETSATLPEHHRQDTDKKPSIEPTMKQEAEGQSDTKDLPRGILINAPAVANLRGGRRSVLQRPRRKA